MADSRKNRSAQLVARREVRNERRELHLGLGETVKELNTKLSHPTNGNGHHPAHSDTTTTVTNAAAEAVNPNEFKAWRDARNAKPEPLQNPFDDLHL
jgi:hypothetical protein